MDIYTKLVSIYRGWDLLEKNKYKGHRIIDFDFAPDSILPFPFKDRFEILNTLINVHDEFGQNCEFYTQKVTASIYYLRCLLGEKITFAEYISKTMGIAPYYITDNEIEIQQYKVKALLENKKLKFQEEDSYNFFNQYRIENPKKLKAKIPILKTSSFKKIKPFISIPYIPDIEILFINVDAYWQSWIKGTYKQGIKVYFNLNPRVIYLVGDPELLTYHELCAHAIQMTHRLENIKTKSKNPFFGLTTVHTPEQFISEGLAQSLTDILFDDDELNADVLFSREYGRYRNFIYNNAHIMINSKESSRSVLLYVKSNLPYEQEKIIESELKDRSTDILYRTYQYVYGISDLFFKKYISSLPSEKKTYLLSILYKDEVTLGNLLKEIGIKFFPFQQN